VIAQQVERDRVQPRLLRAAAAVEPAPLPQRPLERVGQQVLGQRAVSGAVDEEAEQPLGLALVEPLEIRISHHEDLRSGIGGPVRIRE
jgi:hypothetical protein